MANNGYPTSGRSLSKAQPRYNFADELYRLNNKAFHAVRRVPMGTRRLLAGKALTRVVPIAGWALLAYDAWVYRNWITNTLGLPPLFQSVSDGSHFELTSVDSRWERRTGGDFPSTPVYSSYPHKYGSTFNYSYNTYKSANDYRWNQNALVGGYEYFNLISRKPLGSTYWYANIYDGFRKVWEGTYTPVEFYDFDGDMLPGIQTEHFWPSGFEDTPPTIIDPHLEGDTRGYDYPFVTGGTEVPITTTVSTVGGTYHPSTGSDTHTDTPPQPHESEHKTRTNTAVARLAHYLMETTEFVDLVDVLMDSIEGSPPYTLKFTDRLEFISRNLHKLDADLFLANFILNQAEDAVAGRVFGALSKARRNLGVQVSLDFQKTLAKHLGVDFEINPTEVDFGWR